MNSKRVLITGTMRSGTTLINRDVCDSILQISAKSEITPLMESMSLAARWRKNYEKRRYQDWIVGDSLPDLIVDQTFDYLMPNSLDVRYQVGKDPSLTNYADELLGLVLRKDILVLLCVRDPLDVISSAFQVQKRQTYGHTKKFYVDEVFNQFVGLISLLDASESTRNIHVINYERYVANPNKSLGEISKWLEVGYAKTDFKNIQFEVDHNDPYTSILLNKAPSSESIGRYKQDLTSIERHYLTHVFSGIRHRLGYESMPFSPYLKTLGELKTRFWN